MPFLFFIFLFSIFSGAASASAEDSGTATSTQNTIDRQIEEKNREIKQLEEEAQKYRATLGDIGRQADTLAGRIKSLDRTLNGLNADIRLTNAKISRTALEIKALGEDIRAKETSIAAERGRLASLIVIAAEGDRETPLEIIMKNETVSLFFASLDQIGTLQEKIQTLLADLRQVREDLKDRKTRAERKKLELSALSGELKDQKTLQEYERQERANLLKETRNQERRYQELIVEVERKREGLEQEINALEAGLRTAFDSSVIPGAGTGVLGWPLPNVSLASCFKSLAGAANCITQFFGNTSFARAGGYNGKGHNGVDFRAANLTPVFAAERGSVRAAGNTDAVCRRASYGNWILIDHPNNLATLYAHLALAKVGAGEGVNRGELIGYSGNTGYATGPHLHFTVFAREAVQIQKFPSKTCSGRSLTVPISPHGGYLNPIDYL